MGFRLKINVMGVSLLYHTKWYFRSKNTINEAEPMIRIYMALNLSLILIAQKKVRRIKISHFLRCLIT